jgi:hypothetical protein
MYALLKKEVTAHRRMWKARFDHYRKVHDNSSRIKVQTTAILSGNSPKRAFKPERKLLPLPSL